MSQHHTSSMAGAGRPASQTSLDTNDNAWIDFDRQIARKKIQEAERAATIAQYGEDTYALLDKAPSKSPSKSRKKRSVDSKGSRKRRASKSSKSSRKSRKSLDSRKSKKSNESRRSRKKSNDSKGSRKKVVRKGSKSPANKRRGGNTSGSESDSVLIVGGGGQPSPRRIRRKSTKSSQSRSRSRSRSKTPRRPDHPVTPPVPQVPMGDGVKPAPKRPYANMQRKESILDLTPEAAAAAAAAARGQSRLVATNPESDTEGDPFLVKVGRDFKGKTKLDTSDEVTSTRTDVTGVTLTSGMTSEGGGSGHEMSEQLKAYLDDAPNKDFLAEEIEADKQQKEFLKLVADAPIRVSPRRSRPGSPDTASASFTPGFSKFGDAPGIAEMKKKHHHHRRHHKAWSKSTAATAAAHGREPPVRTGSRVHKMRYTSGLGRRRKSSVAQPIEKPPSGGIAGFLANGAGDEPSGSPKSSSKSSAPMTRQASGSFLGRLFGRSNSQMSMATSSSGTSGTSGRSGRSGKSASTAGSKEKKPRVPVMHPGSDEDDRSFSSYSSPSWSSASEGEDDFDVGPEPEEVLGLGADTSDALASLFGGINKANDKVAIDRAFKKKGARYRPSAWEKGGAPPPDSEDGGSVSSSSWSAPPKKIVIQEAKLDDDYTAPAGSGSGPSRSAARPKSALKNPLPKPVDDDDDDLYVPQRRPSHQSAPSGSGSGQASAPSSSKKKKRSVKRLAKKKGGK